MEDGSSEPLLYFQLWGDPETPALKESELISTFNGWLALEERVWLTSRLWEVGKSVDELGCSVCKKGLNESHDSCVESYKRMVEDYSKEETEDEEEGEL
jgi:hypothetical protein